MSDEAGRLSAQELADIQAVIPSGFRELPFAAYLFLHFENALAGRGWLTSLLPVVTTAHAWRPSREAEGPRPKSAANVGLTHAGLEALGLSEASLGTFPEEFRDGMGSPRRSRVLGDSEASHPDTWEVGGTAAPAVHAILVLHAVSEPARAGLVARERARLAECAGVSELAETGQVGHRPDNQKEPFGFRDGIAQPKMKGLGGTDVATGEFVLGYPNHYGFVAPGPLALAQDDPAHHLPDDDNPHHRPRTYRDLGRHGSYLVYRKLQQDVAGFWQLVLREAERLKRGPDPGFAVFLASKLVGRWPSGAPLTLAPEQDDPRLADENRFGYASDDPVGQGCPLGAHIRRVNPRDLVVPCGPTESASITASHRLLRRGRVYGTPLFDQSILDGPLDAGRLEALTMLKDDGQARGIHFLAVCASLHRQFEFMQQTWGNNPRFAGLVDNKDPMVGDSGRAEASPGFVTVPAAPVRARIGPLPALVRVRGGGYFFLPGVAALRSLAHPAARE